MRKLFLFVKWTFLKTNNGYYYNRKPQIYIYFFSVKVSRTEPSSMSIILYIMWCIESNIFFCCLCCRVHLCLHTMMHYSRIEIGKAFGWYKTVWRRKIHWRLEDLVWDSNQSSIPQVISMIYLLEMLCLLFDMYSLVNG